MLFSLFRESQAAKLYAGLSVRPTATLAAQRLARRAFPPFPGEPMLYPVSEIHAAVKRLVQEGYAALTARQQAIVDSLSAVC
jgi:hypothetical protein